jgi:hypothetical protein
VSADSYREERAPLLVLLDLCDVFEIKTLPVALLDEFVRSIPGSMARDPMYLLIKHGVIREDPKEDAGPRG